MERETLLAIVGSALFGVVVWLVALVAGRPSALRSCDTEARTWWRLLVPLFAGTVVLAFLLGWALQEPDPADERVRPGLCLLAVVTAGIAMRALLRSAEALRFSASAKLSVGTVGVLRPRVLVSDSFRKSASDKALQAALAHEAAHVRRRDPLRIWMAQFAADLQWPIPGTERRFSAWLLALEAERDNEAVASGADARDLAEAILVAARLGSDAVVGLTAPRLGPGEAIAWRVRRLLSHDGLSDAATPSRTYFAHEFGAVVVISAIWLGLTYGDAALGLLPGLFR